MKRTIKVAGVVPANDIFYYQSHRLLGILPLKAHFETYDKACMMLSINFLNGFLNKFQCYYIISAYYRRTYLSSRTQLRLSNNNEGFSLCSSLD